jgi:HSP20 family protein
MEREEKTRDLGLMPRFALDFERLFDDFWSRPRLFRRQMNEFTWSPDVEAFEKNGRFNVRVDLPGLKKEDVKVNVVEGMLTIEGERKRELETKKEGYYRSERSYGSFYRALALPEGSKLDQVLATFKDGVLEISLPLALPVKVAKSVEVKVG